MTRWLSLFALLAPLVACDAPEAPSHAITQVTAEPPPTAQPPAASVEVPRGRFTSETVCLELYDSGEIEIVFPHRPPKALVMGTYEATPDGDGVRLDVQVDRIWNTRFVGPCRRIHRSGQFVEEQRSEGFTFQADAATELRLRVRDEDTVELCQQAICVTLTRDEPVLRGRWRLPDFENPTRPPRRFVPGEILELDVGRFPHAWVADSPTSHADYTSLDVAATPLAPGRFRVALTSAHEELPATLGQLTFERRRGQRARVCAGERCTTLERQFSSSEYEVP